MSPDRYSICRNRDRSSSPSTARTPAVARRAEPRRGGAFPAGVTAPVQYGTRIAAFVLYRLLYQLLPEKRLAMLMADLFGVKLVTATIARISNDCAARFHGFVDALRDQVAAAPVKHMDETGFGIGGKTQGCISPRPPGSLFIALRPSAAAPHIGIGCPVLATVTGIVVHDHWKPYYTMPGVLHALCNAHHLREQGVPLKPGLIALIGRCYDGILANGLAFHEAQPSLARAKRRDRPSRRVGHNLLLRLSTRKQDVLRFLTDPNIPFTNNRAERDGRVMKLRQRISGGFRSEDGAKDVAVIRSVLSTARKQGWNMLRTLTSEPARLIADIRVA
jgi:transposase